jgi:hypothetical protein
MSFRQISFSFFSPSQKFQSSPSSPPNCSTTYTCIIYKAINFVILLLHYLKKFDIISFVTLSTNLKPPTGSEIKFKMAVPQFLNASNTKQKKPKNNTKTEPFHVVRLAIFVFNLYWSDYEKHTNTDKYTN